MTRNILDDHYTRRGVANYLNCSERTVSRYENEKDGLPSVTIGGRKYYRKDSLVDWLAKREHRPNPGRVA